MSTSAGYELPWVEKYRPRYLRDVVGNAATIERLQAIEEHGNCPHLLVSGMPGIGKRRACIALRMRSWAMRTRRLFSS